MATLNGRRNWCRYFFKWTKYIRNQTRPNPQNSFKTKQLNALETCEADLSRRKTGKSKKCYF